MGNAFAPVGAALPARRDQMMPATAMPGTPYDPGARDSIIVPEARDRLLDLIEREQLPADVRSTLSGSMTGDLQRQQLLFQAMLDTWPRLQKALREVCLAVRKAPWEVVAYCERGEKPDAAAEKLAKEIERSIWAMRPDMATNKKGFEGTLQEIAMGYYLGFYVGEIHWLRAPKDSPLTWVPACTKTAPPRYYGYPNWEAGEDRLMLDPEGGRHGSQVFVDFPEHKFLVAVNGGHPGHPTVAAPLRALAGFWMAAVFGLKWTMQYAQLFGIPFRWATYTKGDKETKGAVETMLRKTGSQSWAAFPDGTNLNVMDSSKGAGGLAQADLIKIADEQCDVFILGQTLTSSAGDKGTQALGTVHMEVRQELLSGVCDFVGEVLTHQLVPPLVTLNYGPERTDHPGIWAKFEKAKDESGMAQRDKTLGLFDGSFPVAKEWLYERHAVPMPAEGDELFLEKAETLKTEKLKSEDEDEEDDDEEDDEDAKVAAALRLIQARYNPLQPRVPGGEGGGQWTSGGAAGKGKRASRGRMRKATDEERKKFGIAPAFTDPMVTDDPDADLRATAKNAKGKTVYYYSEEYSRSQAAAKFARIGALHQAMPELQARIDEDIMAGGADAEQALALRMITLTGLRNGGEGQAAVYEVIDGKRTKVSEIPTYGASNLAVEHARTEGDTVHLDFPGKKGVRQRHSFTDGKIARHIEAKRAAGAEQIFDGDAGRTLGYLKKISGDKFKVHDFRTWHGTMLGHATVKKLAGRGEVPATAKEFKAFQKRVSKVVGRALGNDPAMSLRAYIHPAIFDPYKPAEPDRKKAA